MLLTTQNIRRYGYQKICKNFIEPCFMNSCKLANGNKVGKRVSAYSMPRIWKGIGRSKYVGMTQLIRYCEPMYDIVDMNNSIQRKFMNTYTHVWADFKEAMGYSDEDIALLSSVGLLYEQIENDCDLLDFFNMIFCWYFKMQSSSDDELEISLKHLILDDDMEFTKFVLEDYVMEY